MNQFIITCSFCSKLLLQGFAGVLDKQVTICASCGDCQKKFEHEENIDQQFQNLVKDL